MLHSLDAIGETRMLGSTSLPCPARACRLDVRILVGLGALAVVFGVAIPIRATEAEHRTVDASAWERRDSAGSVQVDLPLNGANSAARLQWQTPRGHRLQTSSAPRAPGDPFHDPFGDRTSATEVAAQSAPVAPPAKPERFQLSPVPAGGEDAEATPTIRLVQHEVELDSDPQPTPAERPTPAKQTPPQLRPFHLEPVPVPLQTTVTIRTEAPVATSMGEAKDAKSAVKAKPSRKSSATGATTVPPRVAAIAPEPTVAAPVETAPVPSESVAEFRISDPAMSDIRQAQYQQSEGTTDSDEFPDESSEQLDDLFAPRAQQPSTLPPSPQPAAEDETDFNRPFDMEEPSTTDREPGDTVPPNRFEPLAPSEVPPTDAEDLDALLPPETPAPSTTDSAKCAAVYNDRNCCDEEDECRDRIELLRTKTLRSISTDITPPFDPLAETREIARQRQSEQLARSPSRRWNDQRGRLLGEGRLVDIRNRDVIIEQPNGEEAVISSLFLGRDERCFISAWWNLPNDCLPDEGPFPLRDFTMTTYTWTASGLCHRPLYFENVELERYGHSASPWLQPFLSGAHFYSSMALLPYNMGLYPPRECKYALGYYRPGNCAPWLVPAFPISKRAILAEATAIFALYGFIH